MKIKELLLNSRFMRRLAGKKGTLVHNRRDCVFCGKCARVCATGSISVNFKEKDLKIDHDKCMRCGQCVKACPKSALKIERLGGGV